MIKIGGNEVKDRYTTDSSGVPSRVKKVYAQNNLVHLHITDEIPYSFRKVCNGEVGEAVPVKGSIERIKGNTVVWNQLAKDGANEYRYDIDSARTRTFGFENIPSGHKILLFYLVKDAVESTSEINRFGIEYGPGDQIFNPIKNGIFANIVTLQIERHNVYTFIDYRCSSGTAFTMQNFMTFDLTIIYGEGNEPTTPEQFEADYQQWFGKPLTYEPYNEGSLIPVNMTGVKSVGFNQWDEEWENGAYHNITGEKANLNTCIRCKNYIRCLPNTKYATNTNLIRWLFYTEDKTFISWHAEVKQIVSPSNAAYMTFYCGSGYGTTYNHDICINLSDPAKNGTYKAYKSTTVPIPVNRLNNLIT